MSIRRRLALFIDPSITEYFDGDFMMPDVSIEALVREQFQGIIVNGAFIEDMEKEEQVEFLSKASEVFQNPAFQRTIQYLISQQVEHTVKRAASMDEVLFGRATINGLSLCKEQFEALDAQLQEMKKVEEKFDKTEVI